MSKINLLTIHWGCSYGGTMQTYATIRLLKSLGHDVTLINLVHPKFRLRNRNNRFGSWIITDLLFSYFRLSHFGKMTRRMYSINKALIPKSDFTIVGSDQVWNEDITRPINMAYFLNFVDGENKISFSSSFGKYLWENESDTTAYVEKCLSSFKALSVREESGVSICKDVFGRDATHLLDPTLVLDDYSSLVRNAKPDYVIFPFLLVNTKQTEEICKIASETTGLPIYHASKIRSILNSGPKSWLKRMKCSEFIITDSFHGLAFSILFHKRFIVLCADEKKFARLQSLLAKVNLLERFIQSRDDLEARIDVLSDGIDYQAVDTILKKERQKAMAFLSNSLNNLKDE